jgi:hypothetical protein
MNNIFCFWFGPEMSQSRIGCLNTITENSGCNVILVNELNLREYENIDYPIHKGFQFLSATHKCDYLRSYFMYHYGGGYTDIKKCNYSWQPYFEELYISYKEFIGYKEMNGGVATRHDNTHIQNHYDELAGVCHFIFKPKTDFAKLWMEQTNDKMNQVFDKLNKYLQ